MTSNDTLNKRFFILFVCLEVYLQGKYVDVRMLEQRINACTVLVDIASFHPMDDTSLQHHLESLRMYPYGFQRVL